MEAASTSSGRVFVAYHYPCPDGIFAALAANLHFETAERAVTFVPNRVYDPCKVSDLNLKADDDLFLLDYVGPTGFAAAAAMQARRVVILDHHKTAQEALVQDGTAAPSNLEINIDMFRSGATMSLDYFKPKVTDNQKRLFKYIEDADLWRWAFPESKAFHSGFGALGLELDVGKNPGVFEELLKLDPDAVIAKGKEVQTEVDRQIAEAISSCFVINLGGLEGQAKGWGQGLAVRVDSSSNLGSIRSQLGNRLAETAAARGLRAIGVVAYSEPEMRDPSKIKCSLRSIGDEDTTEVSKAFGGGGHLNASSFIFSVQNFESWR